MNCTASVWGCAGFDRKITREFTQIKRTVSRSPGKRWVGWVGTNEYARRLHGNLQAVTLREVKAVLTSEWIR